MILFPPCKINLGLRITEKRADGYHNLETLFYPVRGLCDLLEILPSAEEGIHFTSSGLAVDGPAEANLCVRAARLLGVDGVRIHLRKNIPFGAGLGGGSSDAAATLAGINRVFDLGLSPDRLAEAALQLGSDVPFFLHDGPMIGRGRGEELTPFPLDLSGWHLVLIKPDLHSSTAEAYRAITPRRPGEPIEEILSLPVEAWRERLTNDFEEPLFAKYPLLGEIKARLYDLGAAYAALSGSGSALFGLFRQPVEKEHLTILSDHFIHAETL